jgi:uncharacterized protein (DUF1810 family)
MLDRFKSAQAAPGTGFDDALREIRRGRKSGHWIWYVFPQLAGLGSSSMSRAFGVRDVAEAAEYVRDDELGERLLVITTAVSEQLATRPGALAEVMGSEIDAQKLVSSMTLFERVAGDVFRSEGLERAGKLAAVAAQVLAAAAAQGYPRCAFTRARLGDGTG